MNLTSDRRAASVANEAMLIGPKLDTTPTDPDFDLQNLTALAERFRDAHTRLNSIELELHEALVSGDRFTLLRNLEEARMEYSDARFALSTRHMISGR